MLNMNRSNTWLLLQYARSADRPRSLGSCKLRPASHNVQPGSRKAEATFSRWNCLKTGGVTLLALKKVVDSGEFPR